MPQWCRYEAHLGVLCFAGLGEEGEMVLPGAYGTSLPESFLTNLDVAKV